MATNGDRFKNDLDRLIKQGEGLELAMTYSVDKDRFVSRISRTIGKGKVAELLKRLPSFAVEYEAWYSEALALLRQLLPDRVENFVSFYEKPRNRKTVEYGNYVIQDYLQGLGVTKPDGSLKVGPDAAVPQFRQQLSILKAAKARFESSLFEIRQILQADLFDSEIAAARELLKNKFLRAGGSLAGVVLEKHLMQVSVDRGLQVSKKNPGISDLNELLKGNSVIDVPQWRHISMLADIRNLCAHNKQKEPTQSQVSDLIDGTDKVLRQSHSGGAGCGPLLSHRAAPPRSRLSWPDRGRLRYDLRLASRFGIEKRPDGLASMYRF